MTNVCPATVEQQIHESHRPAVSTTPTVPTTTSPAPTVKPSKPAATTPMPAATTPMPATSTPTTMPATAATTPAGDCRSVRDDAKRANRNGRCQNTLCPLWRKKIINRMCRKYYYAC